MGRRIVYTLWLLCFCAFLAPVNVCAADFRIEQVKTVMPELTMYYYGEKPKEIEGYLDEERLSVVDSYSWKKDKNGIHYYVLVDISASIPDSYFNGMKQGIRKLSESIGKKDRITLISFGDKVNVLYEGKGNTSKIHHKISGLTNRNQNTYFYQAIEKAVSLADKGISKQRQVVLIFSDGENCAKGSVTKSETRKLLQENQLPLYALAIDCAADRYIDKFGEFARSTGGTLQLVSPGSAPDSFCNTKKILEDAGVIRFRKKNNIVTGKKQAFVLSTKKPAYNETVRFIPSKWKEDKKAPQITDAELYKSNQIKITFSEDVLHAGDDGAYVLKYGSRRYVPEKAVYGDKDGYSAILTMPSAVGKGRYRIETNGITDNSMEKNMLTDVYEGDIDGKGFMIRLCFSILHYWWLWLILLALLILLIFLYRLKKHRSTVISEEGIVIGDDAQLKHHIRIQNDRGFPAELDIVTGIRDVKTIPIVIVHSFMVGRSQINDLYFDDTSMSKQHFVLEEEDGMVFIQDLQSSNGTYVNSFRVNGRCQLNSGDNIQAGAVDMTIRW